ncbi:MAG: O-antigen ligase family protein [Campylobacter sp.]|nr:O-antigen ligase family protein [Campylobacter sp.]
MTLSADLKKINFQNFSYEKFYFYASIIFAFTMPISRAAISAFIILFPLVWLIEGDFKRKFDEIKNQKILLIFLIFYAFIALSALLSDNTKTALKFFRLYAYWFTLIVLATSLKKEWIKHIITAFLCGMVVSEMIAYGIFFGLWEYGVGNKINPSPFMFHIDYSVYLAFTSILLFSRIISKDYDVKSKIFMGIFFLSTTGNLFLQTGRTGQVAYIAAIFVMFLLHYRFSFKSIASALLSLIIIYSLAYNFSSSFKIRVNVTKNEIAQITSGNLNTSWGTRLAFWVSTYEILKVHPIFGIDLGDFEEETAEILKLDKFKNYQAYLKEFMSSNHYHNQFLMLAVQMGLIGLGFAILLYYLVLRLALKTEAGEYQNIFVLFWVVYFIGSFADPLWNKQFTSIIWILLVSCMIAYNKKKQNEI